MTIDQLIQSEIHYKAD